MGYLFFMYLMMLTSIFLACLFISAVSSIMTDVYFSALSLAFTETLDSPISYKDSSTIA